MKIKEILREYNEARLLNDFGNKIITRAKEDNTAPKYNTPKQYIEALAKLDPTSNKELVFWLLFKYVKFSKEDNKYGISRWEDISSKAIPALLKFKALLKKPNLEPKLPTKDINQIRDLGALQDILDNYTEKDLTSNNKEENFYKTNQAILFYNDSQVKVVIPKTEEASCYFGVNTRWCTAAKSDNRFNYYNKQGPLYIVLIKKDNKRYQFHYENNQFMDEQDNEINPNKELAKKYPVLWKIFTPIAEKNNSLILNQHPSEKVQLAAVTKDGWAIEYITNPSEKVQLAAVNQNGCAIKCITNPSEKVQLAAVNQNGWAIEYITNPSEKVQLAAVTRNSYAIKYITNPSEKVQLAAVTRNSYAIKCITNPSEKVQLAAVTKDGWEIKFIDNPSEKVQLAAVNRNGWVIEYIMIDNPSEKVQLAAVTRNSYSIKCITNPSEKVQLAAVNQNGYAIQHIRKYNPSEKVQLAAVNQDGYAIEYIKNPSEKVQLAAVTKDGYAIEYIKKPTPKVIALAKSKGYKK